MAEEDSRKAARLTSPTGGTMKGGARPGVVSARRLRVFARLPASSPYIGNFHYAPSAGNRAYSFFEGQIVPHRETERLHKIKTNPLTGNFHSRPGHYSRLHGLQNFRKADSVATGDAGMRRIIARIKTSLTEPSSSALAEATAQDLNLRGFKSPAPTLPHAQHGAKHRDLPLARTAPEFNTPLSASDASSSASAVTVVSAYSPRSHKNKHGGRGAYQKYWEEADTERGRFGTSVDDHALGSSSPVSTDGALVKAAIAAGVKGVGNSGVHWGKHHHHHGAGSDEGMREPLIGDATLRLRHLYFLRKQREANLAAERSRVAGRTGAGLSRGRAVAGGGGGGPASRANAFRRAPPSLKAHRSVPDAWAVALVEARARGSGIGAGVGAGAGSRGVVGGRNASRVKRVSSFAGQGWESHTLKAQQRTEEYMAGKKDLAPDMRPAVVLDNEVSLAYDVDLSEAGVLGAGSYGTVLAAVHRSTGRQVAIKTMLKRYLFSDAEKASVEREIEIQQRLVNDHIIRLYEIYQSPEKLYLVLERAPCGSLEEFLNLRGRMSELGAKRVTRQLLNGLAYLHKVGVVHCDLKPANILFSDIDQGAEALSAEDSDGVEERGDQSVVPRARASSPPASLSGLVVKICDFGHTRKVPDCRYYKFTGDINKIPFHMFKHTGTEGFVAPEVLVQEPYGKAADMWSTGCMVYKMLTGRMPWIPARKCLQKPLSTSGPTWKNISEQAKSLVEDLLHTDQTFRADVDQATHHPWFDGMEHCAMMPTSAPGGKLAGRLSPSSSPKEQSPILDAALGERGIADRQLRPSADELSHLTPTATRVRLTAGARQSLTGTDLSVKVA